MAILATFDFTGQTDGSALTASSPWSVVGTGAATATVKANAIHTGETGIEFDGSTGGSRRLSYTEAQTSATRAPAMYLALTSAPTAITYIQGAVDSADIGAMRINVDRTVSIRNGASVVATSTATLTVGTLYRIERRFSTTGQDLRVYVGEATGTPYITLTGALTTTTHTRFDFGIGIASIGSVYRIDRIAVADDWTGPFGGSGGSFSASGTVAAVSTVSGAVRKAPYAPTIPPILYGAHRGGSPGPEETLYAYRASFAASPTSASEGDMSTLVDGTTVVFNHDTTIDRLADATSGITTGNVNSFTAAQWATAKWKDANGVNPQPAATLAAMVTDHKPGGQQAGRLAIWEINTTSSYVTILNALDAAGMGNQIIIQTFSMTAATESAGRGYVTCWLGNTPDFPAMKAAGIGWWGINSTVLAADYTQIATAHSYGIKVMPFTINTTTARDDLIGRGVDGMFTDNPEILAPLLTASGTVTATSTASGTVAARLPASATVAATSAVSGAATSLLPTSGSAAASSGVSGGITAKLAAAGAVASTSTVSGSPSIIGGPASYPAAGTIAATSGASGSVLARLVASGTVVGTVTVSGSPTVVSDEPSVTIVAAVARTRMIPAETRTFAVPSETRRLT